MSDSSSQRNGSAGDRRRGGYGLRALGSSLTAVTKRAFARRGLTGADLARQWPAIVGRDLAAQCRPRQLRFPKAGEAVDGRLTLRVAPGWALEVQHLEPLMLERINGYFGYRAVTRLVLQQGPLPPLRDAGAERRRQTREAPPARLDESLAEKLSTVEDPELRAALEGLGRSLKGRRDRSAKNP
ncbi:DUF721 domain-containing protein [Pelagibius marinus]|uniref:DUF721 domain-containing protein n=1 Tax=Pelagibius marinus TaxID=2762760 RepID=UPI00187240A9|nr:DUF721 domain-containing protein [Pelagibius marinus]